MLLYLRATLASIPLRLPVTPPESLHVTRRPGRAHQVDAHQGASRHCSQRGDRSVGDGQPTVCRPKTLNAKALFAELQWGKGC